MKDWSVRGVRRLTHPINFILLLSIFVGTILGLARVNWRTPGRTGIRGSQASFKPAPAPLHGSRAEGTRWNEVYGRLPLSFEANEGQTDSRVRFISRGRDYALFLT